MNGQTQYPHFRRPCKIHTRDVFGLVKQTTMVMETIERIDIAFEYPEDYFEQHADTTKAVELARLLTKDPSWHRYDLKWMWKRELQKGNIVRCRCVYAAPDESGKLKDSATINIYPSWEMLHQAQVEGDALNLTVLEQFTSSVGVNSARIATDDEEMSLIEKDFLQSEVPDYLTGQVRYIDAVLGDGCITRRPTQVLRQERSRYVIAAMHLLQ